jgi:hypothetical protein
LPATPARSVPARHLFARLGGLATLLAGALDPKIITS